MPQKMNMEVWTMRISCKSMLDLSRNGMILDTITSYRNIHQIIAAIHVRTFSPFSLEETSVTFSNHILCRKTLVINVYTYFDHMLHQPAPLALSH